MYGIWSNNGLELFYETARPDKGSVRVTFLQNFLDELRRQIPGR